MMKASVVLLVLCLNQSAFAQQRLQEGGVTGSGFPEPILAKSMTSTIFGPKPFKKECTVGISHSGTNVNGTKSERRATTARPFKSTAEVSAAIQKVAKIAPITSHGRPDIVAETVLYFSPGKKIILDSNKGNVAISIPGKLSEKLRKFVSNNCGM